MGGIFITFIKMGGLVNQKTPFQPDSKLVVYLRDSGGDEQEMSIEQQEDVLHKWCAESMCSPAHRSTTECVLGATHCYTAITAS